MAFVGIGLYQRIVFLSSAKIERKSRQKAYPFAFILGNVMGFVNGV